MGWSTLFAADPNWLPLTVPILQKLHESLDMVDGANESFDHADAGKPPLVLNFSPSRTILKKIDVFHLGCEFRLLRTCHVICAFAPA